MGQIRIRKGRASHDLGLFEVIKMKQLLGLRREEQLIK